MHYTFLSFIIFIIVCGFCFCFRRSTNIYGQHFVHTNNNTRWKQRENTHEIVGKPEMIHKSESCAEARLSIFEKPCADVFTILYFTNNHNDEEIVFGLCTHTPHSIHSTLTFPSHFTF